MAENFLIREIKNTFSPTGKMVSRLIVINIIVFLVLRLISLFGDLSGNYPHMDKVISYLALPASLSKLIYRPWTIITYAFTHFELFHIVFNMLWLYWVGSILSEFIGNKKFFRFT